MKTVLVHSLISAYPFALTKEFTQKVILAYTTNLHKVLLKIKTLCNKIYNCLVFLLFFDSTKTMKESVVKIRGTMFDGIVA
jgi:hypothetical protein